MTSEINYKPSGFFRRLVALFYDLILILGLCITFALVVVYLVGGAIEHPLMYVSFLTLSFLFYCYFWKFNKGQTLGMQIWKIKLVDEEGKLPSLAKMLSRCFLGMIFTLLGGINFLPILFRKDKKSLNDLLSKTRIIKT